MKKIIFSLATSALVLASCDPVLDEKDFDPVRVSAEELNNLISFVQYDKKDSITPAADGNWITYKTTPGTIVTIYNYNSAGEEVLLSYGSSDGAFLLSPRRKSDPNQKIYLRILNSDGSVVEAEKTLNVFVPSELTPEVRLLSSDAYGYKVWTYDTEFREDGAVWGNIGYAGGSGADWATGVVGYWWGCDPETLATPDQIVHNGTGIANGEEDRNAYMTFSDEGVVTTYTAAGKEIRSASYSVTSYDGGKRTVKSIDGSQEDWAVGYLETSKAGMLWQFQINASSHDNVTSPLKQEIVYLDANHLRLCYAAEGTGSWGEATWWAYKSCGDAEENLANASTTKEKKWTWDTTVRDDAGAWGNIGYAGGDGSEWASGIVGAWWGCAPADLTDQLQHSDTGLATGEEDPNAYMIFNNSTNTVTSYAADGKEIRKGAFEIQNWGNGLRTIASIDGSQKNWALGNLHTDAGSILFPFQINGNGNKPTDFEIVLLTDTQLRLVYAAEGTGSWEEATWWAFKAVTE